MTPEQTESCANWFNSYLFFNKNMPLYDYYALSKEEREQIHTEWHNWRQMYFKNKVGITLILQKKYRFINKPQEENAT